MGFSPPVGQPLAIAGPAGSIEAMLEVPVGTAATAWGVICHPHPLHGGTMHNKVVHMLARSLHQLGIPTLRFNFRGVGASEGVHDAGRGETADVLAVVAHGRGLWPEAKLILGGFSFGAVVALRACATAQPDDLITVAPAVDRVYADELPAVRCPWLLVQGAADEVVAADAVAQFAQRQQPVPTLAWLADTGHFFHGRLALLQDTVQDFLRPQLAPRGP